MRFLVVGLGSMGKRRIRNLQAIGGHEISGFDLRNDRRNEAHQTYGLEVYDNYESAINKFMPDALVISTPPDLHMYYAHDAFNKGLHSFVEASVNDAENILDLHEKSKNSDVVVAPSCTMSYFEGPKLVRSLVKEGVIGRALSYTYQTGQYLPDWHPWEDIKDFYVSNRETGGCREIVAFELSWLDNIFGSSQALAGVNTKVSNLDVDIDDIYHSLVRHNGETIGNICIEVLSRPVATRELRIIGEDGLICFSGERKEVRFRNSKMDDWQVHELGKQKTIESKYINPEEPYIDEMRDFVNACLHKNKELFPNNLLDDYRILKTVYQLESMSAL